jgi:hypothetical protein
VRNGIAMKKIMMVPCVEKSWAKWSAERNPPCSPSACWARITTPSSAPRTSMISASTIYITPIRLWSMLISHFDHMGPQSRNQVNSAAVTAAPKITTQAAPDRMMSFNPG